MNATIVSTNEALDVKCHNRKKISWQGIFAGAITALVVETLLNLLGLGVGLISFTPDQAMAASLSIGSSIWLILVSVLALFLAGWVATLSAGKISVSGALQGFLTWAIASLIVWMLMASAGGAILGGLTNLVAGGLKSTGNIAMSQKDNVNIFKLPALASLQQRVKSGVDVEKIVEDLQEPLKAYVSADNDQERQDAVQLLSVSIARNTDYSTAEVQSKVEDIENWALKMKNNAAEAAKKTSRFLGSVALASFFAFLMGAIAAILGGVVGQVQNRNNYL